MKVRLTWAIIFAIVLFSCGFLQVVFADTSGVNEIGTPFVYLDKWGGPVGTIVTVRCSGFYPAKLINFKYSYPSNSQLMISKISDANGACQIDFIIPASPEGGNYIIAGNELGQSVVTEFTVIPDLKINPANATFGDEVSVRGTGFPAEDKVSLYINGLGISDVFTEANGSFTMIFTVPALKSGVNLVEVKDQQGDVRWLELGVTSKLAINKTSGEVGARLNLNGTGFESDAPVQIKFDSADILTIDTDELGKFSTAISVPVTKAGPHFISVTDGVNTQQLMFTIENVPPPVPELLSPRGKVTVKQPISFDWVSVFDPSEPVNYEIEIARDINFREPVIKKELAESQYVQNSGENLQPNRRWGNYYWRVKATDSAGNVSDWSAVAAFHVPPQFSLPVWAKYMLGFFGVSIAIVYGVLLSGALNPLKKKTGD